MRHLDLFSGYGGFTIACDELGIETIGFSEVEKHAIAVLKYRFPNIKNYGDITKLKWNQLPDFDLLTGGSPCQDFSIAGKRQGLEGARSSLAWEFIRGLRIKKPRYFLWENVKGVMSSRSGWDFANLISAFSESGYALWWQVLNAKDFGVPQNRERIFVLGVRNGSPKEIFFEGKNIKIIKRDQIDVSKKGYNSQQDRFYDSDEIMSCLPHTNPDNKLGLAKEERYLMPIECERLMGLPDDWTRFGVSERFTYTKTVPDVYELSDSARYKLCGNGVVVNVVKEIMKSLLNKS
jgi:DNA (cytosine-5)-methyltransferase 1